MMKFFRPALLVLGLLAACGSTDAVTTNDMWARPTAPDAPNAAFYGSVVNNTDKSVSLVDGYSPACDRIEIHRSVMTDGVMSMGPADPADITIAPGGSLVLEPMGLHVMCFDVVEPLVAGSPVTLELTFEETGVVITEVVVEQR